MKIQMTKETNCFKKQRVINSFNSLLLGIFLFFPFNNIFATADLEIDITYLVTSMYITTKNVNSTDCEFVEGCILATGNIKLLRFGTRTKNIGSSDLVIGNPDNPQISGLVFSDPECQLHQDEHKHFESFANYELYDFNCVNVLVGHKMGFCLQNSGSISGGGSCGTSWVSCNPHIGGFNCGCQGIGKGCYDDYPPTTTCQLIVFEKTITSDNVVIDLSKEAKGLYSVNIIHGKTIITELISHQ